MSVNVVTPEVYAGAVTGSICARRGRVTGMEARGTTHVVKGMVPLGTMFGYVSELRNKTQGRAVYTMHFEHYEAVPYAIAEEIIEASRRDKGKKR